MGPGHRIRRRLREGPWAAAILALIGADIRLFDSLLPGDRGAIEMNGTRYEWNSRADVLKLVFQLAGVEAADHPPGIYVKWRQGIFFTVNDSPEPVRIPLREGAAVFIGTNPLLPAEVLVWR